VKKAIIIMLSLLIAVPVMAKDTVKIGISQIVEHPALDAVRDGIIKSAEECGYKNGENIEFDTQVAAGNIVTANQISAKFVGDKKDAVIGIATPTALALINTYVKKAPNVPVLFAAVTDPVGAKMVRNLEKPGGMVTGVSDLAPIDSQFGLIFEMGFKPKAVGIIYNSGEQNSRSQLKLAQKAAEKRGVELIARAVANSSGVYGAAQSLIGKVQALYVTTDNTVVSALESVVKVANEQKLPLIMSDTSSVDRGALGAKGFDYYKHGLQAGQILCRVLKGEKPGNIPVEFQKDLKLVVNANTAKAIGYEISDEILKKADKVVK
jgi:putative ABC transport system substrate-binding protein